MSKLTYNVYVDEVFENFMNLPRMDGYFCYVGLMLPENKEEQLRSFWNALDERLRRAYQAATNHRIEGEFKSTFLTKLSSETRRDAAQRIAYFLSKNSGFIGAYYTSVHGLLCWEIRTSASYEDSETLPAFDPSKVEEMAAQFRDEKKTSVGESRILGGLFHTIAAIPLSWLGILGARFRICYDSRNPKEDRVLIKMVDDFFPRMVELHPNRMALYDGATAFPDSSKVPGLMLADIICEELRNFVHACPEILTDRSEYRLITPRSSEGIPIPTEVGGLTLKWGSAKQMSPPTSQKLVRLMRTEPFGLLLPNLADHKLSCYGHFGEGRIVDFAHSLFNDQVD